MTKPLSIAMDGPVGAGKSTIADAVAQKLNILHLDTGAMYRAVGLYMNRLGILNDAEAVAARVDEVPLDVRHIDGKQRVFLGDEDVSEAIRQPEISMAASAVGAVPAVRTRLVDLQREIARKLSIIMDGRDIGTVVLPGAQVKIFLTAAAEVRAQRRMKELEQRGTPQPFAEVLQQIVERDWADSHREAAPLRQAEDAVLLDTSELNFDESLEAMLAIIRGRAGL